MYILFIKKKLKDEKLKIKSIESIYTNHNIIYRTIKQLESDISNINLMTKME